MDSEKVKLTGLWRGQLKDGGQYLSGRLSPTSKLLIYPNTYKKTDKDPDYIAYMAPVREETERTRQPQPPEGLL